MADEAIKIWYDLRKKAIHDKVGVHDILRRNGVKFRHTGDREEQFSCPFHGKDEKPSARAFPTDPRSPSHVWCYVCRERWDVIALWKKYYGSDKKFHAVLSEIEKYYNIIPPPVPEGAFKQQPSGNEQQKLDFERLYQACEDRLVAERGAYVQMGDMNGFLVAGSILDKATFQVAEGTLSYLEGLELMKKLLKKIGERVRSASADQAFHS